MAALRAASVVEITDFLPSPKPIKRWKPGALVRVIGVGAAILALALVTWLFAPNPAAPVKAPAVVAAAIPQAGTVLHDCPACPGVTVLPAGRFEQGSKYTDTAASPFEKPLHVVAIAYPFAMCWMQYTGSRSIRNEPKPENYRIFEPDQRPQNPPQPRYAQLTTDNGQLTST